MEDRSEASAREAHGVWRAHVAGDTTRQTFQYVKVSGREDLRYFPDFLIVGPQRTGTTWLHFHLRDHPEIMLTEPKELYFFSNLKTPDRPRFQSNQLEWYLRFFHEPLWRVGLHHAHSLWRYREPYRPKIRGEATASYAALDRDVIQEISALRPELRVILMIRNPVDRAWSHAKKDLVRNRGRAFEEVSEEEFKRFFTDPYQLRCAQYAENIDNWSAHLQPGRLLVGLFDDIDSRPEALLLEVMSFLGVTSDRRYVSSAIGEAVNPTPSSQIPDRYRRFLEELLKDDIARLEQRFGLCWSSETSRTRLERRVRRGPAHSDRFVLALSE
jgi:hypothetical protein